MQPPCIRVNNLAPRHVTIYVKAEFFNPAASVKDRLAISIIEAAERSGVLKPGQTVVEATSGNTGIGLAMVCAQKGYPLVVTMADSFARDPRRLQGPAAGLLRDRVRHGRHRHWRWAGAAPREA